MTDNHEDRLSEVELDQRAFDNLEIAAAADREAVRSLKIWVAALQRMVASRPSIGDSLLAARDEERRRG